MGKHIVDARPERYRRGSIFSLVLGFVLLFAGGCLLLGPSVSAVLEQERAERIVAEYRDESAVLNILPDDGSQDDNLKEDDPTYRALEEYSERVRTGTGDAVNDPFAFSADELAEIGLPDGIVGVLDIPRMGVSLPLYLGSTYEHMASGATVIAGTSMPIGGTSSNCVIAAHRGVWYGLQMFRDIELLRMGDTLTITTAWDVLTYRVCEVRVIQPDDVSALAVQEGRDLVTLFTCHPYGEHTQRYLVYCERVEDVEAQAGPSPLERAVRSYLPAPAEDSPSLTVEFVARVMGLVALVIVAIALVAALIRRVRR